MVYLLVMIALFVSLYYVNKMSEQAKQSNNSQPTNSSTTETSPEVSPVSENTSTASPSPSSSPANQSSSDSSSMKQSMQWEEPPKMSIDQKKKYQAKFSTSKGDFTIDLYAKEAPITVNNFVFLAKKGYYDGVLFHRVIENFMIKQVTPQVQEVVVLDINFKMN
jgi:hypothetical protein